MDLRTLSIEDVRHIHAALTEEFANTDNPISPPGVKSETLLGSAVLRQHVANGATMKYPTPIENAATLMYGICCDHPFHNGNKRTALVAMLAHLDKNKLTLMDVRQKETFDLVLSVATHTRIGEKGKTHLLVPGRPNADAEVPAIASWLKQWASPVTRGEKQITYRQLRHILNRFSFSIENPDGNTIEVGRLVKERRGLLRPKEDVVFKRISSIRYPSDNEFVPITHLKQIRALCKLREEDGVDSNAFYGDGAVVDTFINQYRTILRKLANR